MDGPLDGLLWFYNQRAGAEPLGVSFCQTDPSDKTFTPLAQRDNFRIAHARKLPHMIVALVYILTDHRF
jgi:hypothetical protein